MCSTTTSTILSADEAKSPLFRSLRDIDLIDDPELRLAAALDRLDHISKLALARSRLAGDKTIVDPDCHAAIKVEEVAHRLLEVNPRKRKVAPPDMSAFASPPKLEAVK